MPILLALDASTEACSCAVLKDGAVSERFEISPRQHTQLLLPMIDELMRDTAVEYSQLDAIAFGNGPGSFTGLRIAAGIVQGLAFATGCPVVPVSTLAAVATAAAECFTDTLVFSSLDARIDEIYWGWYLVSQGKPKLLGEEQLCRPEAVTMAPPLRTLPILAAGNGLLYQNRLPVELVSSFSAVRSELLPVSSHIVRIAEQLWHEKSIISPADINPVYLRDKVTQ